jgi:hypothetical protein
MKICHQADEALEGRGDSSPGDMAKGLCNSNTRRVAPPLSRSYTIRLVVLGMDCCFNTIRLVNQSLLLTLYYFKTLKQIYYNKFGLNYCLKTEVLGLSDSQRGYSSASYVYLIFLMVPSNIHIYLKSIGSYVLHQRMIKSK